MVQLFIYISSHPPLRMQVTFLQNTHGGLAFEAPFQWTVWWCSQWPHTPTPWNTTGWRENSAIHFNFDHETIAVFLFFVDHSCDRIACNFKHQAYPSQHFYRSWRRTKHCCAATDDAHVGSLHTVQWAPTMLQKMASTIFLTFMPLNIIVFHHLQRL
jgi:hypothetical protein